MLDEKGNLSENEVWDVPSDFRCGPNVTREREVTFEVRVLIKSPSIHGRLTLKYCLLNIDNASSASALANFSYKHDKDAFEEDLAACSTTSPRATRERLSTADEQHYPPGDVVDAEPLRASRTGGAKAQSHRHHSFLRRHEGKFPCYFHSGCAQSIWKDLHRLLADHLDHAHASAHEKAWPRRAGGARSGRTARLQLRGYG